jgi:L-ascorbate metabolism protein UlaG (beta-lactamase superfamily)
MFKNPKIKSRMSLLFAAIAAPPILVGLFLYHPIFGGKAKGDRLERMLASPNYQEGAFANKSYTPTFTEGSSVSKVMFNFFFNKGKNNTPPTTIPNIKTDLFNLPDGDVLVWFGHSSYFLKTDGIRILVDPVFSGNASPIPGSTKAFEGANEYGVDDIPEIDYLFISHDHYDHLDYPTIQKLRSKVKKVICGLGVGAHFERWGYAKAIITEMDWNEQIEPELGMKVYGLPARHFSGRTFKRNTTLWLSFLLETPTKKIYLGGDSGYDTHFKEIGDLHGPIDFAILENGQYNEAWKAIHFLPGENLQAAKDLQAKRLMPVHSAKFSLALHDWDEPLEEMVRLNEKFQIPLATPKIGELVNLNDPNQTFGEWWREMARR